MYYSEDSPQLAYGLERYLIDMREALVERAIENNPAFAEALTQARKTGQISARVLDILVQAADLKPATPMPADPISKWFRPKTASALRAEGLHLLSDLVALIERRGTGWWRAVPRIGNGRAHVIVRCKRPARPPIVLA